MSKISNLKNYFGFHLVEMTSDKYNLENPELDINAKNSLEKELAQNIEEIEKREGDGTNKRVEISSNRRKVSPRSKSPRMRDGRTEQSSPGSSEGRESR